MQLTGFDRWLREHFVLETHVYTMRPPEIPFSVVRYEELPEAAGRKYKHLYVLRNEKKLNAFIDILKANGQMFTTRVVDRKAWYVPYVAPKNNRSVTWWVVGNLGILSAVIYVVKLGLNFWADPTFRQNVMESLKILKS